MSIQKKEEREGHTWASNLKCMRKWTSKKIIYLKTHRTSLVAQMVKCLSTTRDTQVRTLGQEDPLEKEMAIHSSTIARLLCPWDFPGKNIGVDCHSLLQGIFPTQGSNLGLLPWGWILYCLSHVESPNKCIISVICSCPTLFLSHRILQARILDWIAIPFSSPGHLPNPGIEPVLSPAFQMHFLHSEPTGKP